MDEIEKQAVAVTRFIGKVATILGKTYAIRGDDYTLEDDTALLRIRDLIDGIDDKLIERNKNKRLSR